MYINFERFTESARPAAPKNIITEADERQALMAVKDTTGRRGLPAVILSDFDLTLCDTFGFDPATNNHEPQLDQTVIDAAQGNTLVVATARRANHPWLPELWNSGLVAPRMPVITENGGVINVPDGKGSFDHINLVPKNKIDMMQEWIEDAAGQLHRIPRNQRFIKKLGMTSIIARLQDESGNSTVDHQQILLKDLQDIGIPDGIEVSRTGRSLSIQSEGVNKASGFREVLNLAGVDRRDITVIGIGDAPNDAAIFKEADLSIGVDRRVKNMVNIAMNRGVESTKLVLKMSARGLVPFDLESKF